MKISRKVRDSLISKVWPRVEKEFGSENRYAFERNIRNYWQAWNGIRTEEEGYGGFHDLHVPFVHDAIEAAVKRDMATFFPVSNEWVNVTSDDQEAAWKVEKVLNHHLTSSNFMDICRIAARSARISGTTVLYVDWTNTTRMVPNETRVDESQPEEISEVSEEGPLFRCVSPENFLVLPVTVLAIRDANLVAERRFLDLPTYRKMVDDGIFEADRLIEKYLSGQIEDAEKEIIEAKKHGIGAKGEGIGTVIGVVDVWTDYDIGNGLEPVLITFSKGIVLRAEPAPRKRIPYFSVARKSDGQFFFGHGDVQYVLSLQEASIDFLNQGADSATFAINPMIAVDPTKTPNYKSFVLEPGAIWTGGAPAPIELPNMAPEALALVQELKRQVQETMGLTPPINIDQGRKQPAAVAAMMSAEIQMAEQDWARNFEKNILVPVTKWLYELDQEHRENAIVTSGADDSLLSLGAEKFPEAQFLFNWLGSRQAANPVKGQQVLTALNILSRIPPQAMQGKTLDISPLLEYLLGSIFALPVADKVIVDPKESPSIDPNIENAGLIHNVFLETHPEDNDQQHLQIHAQVQTEAAQRHIREHMAQFQEKQQAQQQQQMAALQQRMQGSSQPKRPRGTKPKNMGAPEPAQGLSALMGGMNG